MAEASTYMDYDEVGSLADRVAEAAEALGDGHTALAEAPATSRSSPAPYIPAWNAFGNTGSAGDCSSAYFDLQRAGLTAAERLGAILAGDNKRLDDTIRCFQETDHLSADQICAAGGSRLNVYSTHVHSGGTESDDVLRADQVDDVRENIDGPAVIGADLNAELDDGNRSADAISVFEDQGYDVHAGGTDESGDVVGTSSGGRLIDYVITTPGVSASEPELIDTEGLSDHQGQLTEITVHDWD